MRRAEDYVAKGRNTTGVHLVSPAAPMPRTGGLHDLHNARQARAAKRLQERAQATPAWASKPYTCPELRPLAGIPASRMAAYHLPSRVNNTLRHPGGRVTDLDGNTLEK